MTKIDPATAQDTIDRLKSLMPVKTPRHLNSNSQRSSKDFDVMKVFSALTHISPPPGMVLDYVYRCDRIGGEPILYLRGIDQPPIKTEREAEEKWGIELSPECALYSDLTPQGFFELTLFGLMAGQFYLFWHANYNDVVVIGDLEGVKRVFEKESSFSPPKKLKPRAMALDPHPTVKEQGDAVGVSVLTFTAWGGFIRRAFLFSKDRPHRLLDGNGKILVPYNCDITF